mmetsp:Transcript_97417/g.314156  ORF Transcript_97417/g.314156 Transcript_97417/m.314156 type:complete len:230 (+) Transcript_97417:821-1510(+)
MPWTSTPICSASAAWGNSKTSTSSMSPSDTEEPRSLTPSKVTLPAVFSDLENHPPVYSPGVTPKIDWPFGVKAFAGKPAPSKKVSGRLPPLVSSITSSKPAPSMLLGILNISTLVAARASPASTAMASEETVASTSKTPPPAADAAALRSCLTMGLPSHEPAMPWSNTQPRPGILRKFGPSAPKGDETSSTSNCSPTSRISPVGVAATSAPLRTRIFVRDLNFPTVGRA